jgi:competence protein ComEC
MKLPGRPSLSQATAMAAKLSGQRQALASPWLEKNWPSIWWGQEVERRSLFHLLPVVFGCGILLYFSAEGRPSYGPGLIGASLATMLIFFFRHTFAPRIFLTGFMFLFLGFSVAAWRTEMVTAPLISRTLIAPMTGFIESVEEREDGGARLLLRPYLIKDVASENRPALVRVSVSELGALKPGDFISATARLLPPPEPARPGGYDFARDAFYKGIGGVGSLVGKVRVEPPPLPADWNLRFNAALDEARIALTRRIAGAIGGQPGAVTAALVTGKRGLINEETNDALRAAGIYHIVSISGLHMVMAAGVIFWLSRAFLALSVAACLTWPIKKISAIFAMVGASAYCIFSGSEVATERSLVMTLVMLGAILADRPALSLRNLSLSALIVLAREPESLLGPSFQMSFGAVAALIAAAEAMRRYHHARDDFGPVTAFLRKTTMAGAAMIGTTLVAGIATAPFGAYHFQVLNAYGVIGNALALPLVSLIIMPGAVIGLLLYPFGLDRWIWDMMGFATEQVLVVSSWVGSFGGANLGLPAFGTPALLLLSLALLLVTLLTTPLRWIGLVSGFLGLWLASSPLRPVLYVDREGSGAMFRNDQGRLSALGKPSGFVMEQWLRADGDIRSTDDDDIMDQMRCDAIGCVGYIPNVGFVSHIISPRAFEQDCARARIIITRLKAPTTCKGPLIIDREVLQQKGAVHLVDNKGKLDVVGTRRIHEDRPWLVKTPALKTPVKPYAKPDSVSEGSTAEDVLGDRGE